MGIAEDLIDTLKSLCGLLTESRIEFCLIGGLAVSILAKPRATEDIDLLVLIEESQLPSLGSLLQRRFSVIQAANIVRFKTATICRTTLVPPSGKNDAPVVVDFLLADREVYREALRDPIELIVDGVKIPVSRPESLIRMKEISNRPQDMIDIEAVKAAMSEGA
jgi:predicted nucleotidyltransferase